MPHIDHSKKLTLQQNIASKLGLNSGFVKLEIISLTIILIGVVMASFIYTSLRTEEGPDQTNNTIDYKEYKKPEDNKTWGIFFKNLFGKDQEHFNKSYAVVIGIGDYNSDWLDLTASPVDVQRVYDYLTKEAGFDYVVMLMDKKATKQKIEKLMEEFFPNQVGKDDRFLFYFSGHGTQRKIGNDLLQGYLVLQSSKATTYADMISMKEIEHWDSLLASKQTLFILDACFSGAAGIQLKSPLTNKKLERLSQDGHHLITAGTANEQSIASIEKWNGSLFTYALIRGIRGNADSATIDHPVDGIISLKELMKYIEDTIDKELDDLLDYDKTMSPQMFELRNSPGEFFFISKKYEDDSPKTNGQDATTNPIDIIVPKENIYYTVTLILPEEMAGADIRVDGKPATILDDSQIVVKIRVKKKDTNHKITLQKYNKLCSKDLFIRKDINDLTPCS